MKLTYALSALGLLIAAAFASEQGVSRPGGVYLTMPMASAEACSAACSDDNLCMAWSFAMAERACELKAIAPAPVRAEGVVSGLSQRAPAFVRVEAAPIEAPAPMPPEPPTERLAPTTLARASVGSDDELLGGPIDGGDDSMPLRSHLPDER